MGRETMKRLRSAMNLILFAIPAAGGALSFIVVPPSGAVTITTPDMEEGLCGGHRLRHSGGCCSVRKIRCSRGGRQKNSMQMGATVDGTTGMRASERRASSAAVSVAELPSDAPAGGRRLQDRHQHRMAGSVLGDCRLRRRLRKLGKLGKPLNVLESLAVAKQRGDVISLRVFNTAVAAVAPCEDGWQYAMRLLALMQEEQVAPDRFTLSAIVASCLRGHEWNMAHGVLQKMQRQGMRPLDMRPGRLTTAPGEAGEARDRVMRLLQRLRSTDDPRPPAAPSPSWEKRQAAGAGDEDGDCGDGYGDGGDITGQHSVRSADGMVACDDGGARQRRGNSDERETGTAISDVISRNGAATVVDGRGSGGGNDGGGRGERGGAWDVLGLERDEGRDKAADELRAVGLRPTEEVFLSQLKAAAKTKNWEGALRLLDGMREAGYRPRPGAYACAMRACGKARKWEQSLALMDDLRSRGVEPGEGCNVMALKACADAGLWEKTLEMLKDMSTQGVNRSESTFVVAMKACGDAGRWKEALVLMDDMRKGGIPPMEITYTTAMKACGNAGAWEQALKLLQEMQDMGIPPTEQCFTAAIRACAKADEAIKASSLLLQMRAARGVSTNMSSYRAVINALCRAGDWASAQGLLEDARKDQLKPGAGELRVMLEAYGKAGQHERALSLLEEMRSEGMNLRRTGERLWWVFDTCRDKRVKDRAWLLMEVEKTRERVRLRAERNARRVTTTASAAVVTATFT